MVSFGLVRRLLEKGTEMRYETQGRKQKGLLRRNLGGTSLVKVSFIQMIKHACDLFVDLLTD